MPREDVESKGRRYLTEGRLTIRLVDARRIEAIVKGGGEFYRVGYEAGGWFCYCPALGRCSHLVALMLCTTRPGGIR